MSRALAGTQTGVVHAPDGPVVIALIVTIEGFPVADEVLAGNTSDKTTLTDFLRKIEAQYGRAERIWVMDRGIPAAPQHHRRAFRRGVVAVLHSVDESGSGL